MLRLLAKVWDRTLPGAWKGAATRLASPVERVRGFLQELGAERVLIHADRAAFESARAALAGIECVGATNDLVEIEAGIPHVEDVDWRGLDAAVAAGTDFAGRYRQLLRLAARVHPSPPVLWIGEGFDLCGTALSAPAGIDNLDALLFNHFNTFAGIADPLQFRIEVYHGPDVKRSWRILAPDQSHMIRLGESFPERRHPVAVAAFVEHPTLARDGADDFKLCADLFWRDSLTTLHSASVTLPGDSLGEARRPQRGVAKRDAAARGVAELRLPAWLVREGMAALTLPTSGAKLEAIVDGKTEKVPREAARHVVQSVIQRARIPDDRFIGWRSQGLGGSSWVAMEGPAALSGGHAGNIAGDRAVSAPVPAGGSIAPRPEERESTQRLERDGFVLDPHAVPLLPDDDDLVFAFEADAAGPQLRDYRLDYFDRRGRHLGTLRHAKDMPGPLFPRELADQAGEDVKAQARLALVSQDWLKARHRNDGVRQAATLLVRNRRTGDQDVTELQSCWRNLGMAVPGFPERRSDDLGLFGRTHAFGRVRCDQGLRTGLVMVNGSGRLGYRLSAQVTLAVFNHAGLQISTELDLPAFTWRLAWLDETMPLLPAHLGGGSGALVVRASDAELVCQIVTTTPKGAVSLQQI